MSILDTIMQELPAEHASGGSGGLPGLLDRLLQGGEQGGLTGLAQKFQSAGLGEVFQSWVGGGPNRPVDAADVNRALGDEHVQSLAAQSGISKERLLPLLAQYLPKLVDRLTPEGQMRAQQAPAEL
jgi:uncharacterized protein YidB (DUF937 family)